ADILAHFERKERDLETLYTNSKLAHAPDEAKIKQLLLDCLEHHYGSLSECVVNVDAAADTLRRIRGILEQAGY
ncbi:MAG: putative nucleotidyltransferase, partial [Capsulimonas sp.]|nr:putative nucleotidyltransferase [Capsulimonas sp.]